MGLSLKGMFAPDGTIDFWAYQLCVNPELGRFETENVQKYFAPNYSYTQIDAALINTFGSLCAPPRPEAEIATLAQFQRVYEFGKFPNVKDWLLWLRDNTDLKLTRRELYEYVIRSNGTEFKPVDKRVRYAVNVY